MTSGASPKKSRALATRRVQEASIEVDVFGYMLAEVGKEGLFQKSEWGDGPWQTEPDMVAWEHDGYPCLLHRALGGFWIGFVAVPPGHPWYGLKADDVPARAYRGVSFTCASDILRYTPKWSDAWWVGFEAGHSVDYSPAHEARMDKLMLKEGWGMAPQIAVLDHATGEIHMRDRKVAYKTVDFMREETEKLARLAKEAAGG